ncbi:hypothetical protein [Leifsonia sp. AG29]|uniref:hypothetical protein n=1 Tax=Leifsonia sp. AG29 TaxID=2598860 RepID=UPI00131A617C|nr:hypothetical protein [Leifsonia sp. AG29]
MVDPMDVRVVLIDGPTAATLAQVLPLLLLTLMVEQRRVKLHTRGRSVVVTRVLLGAFFLAFAVVESVLVLSIDGSLIPFKWTDLAISLAIFGLLAVLFMLSLLEAPDEREKRKRT